MEYANVLIILACLFGLFMAWGIGANDVANAMGTSVGSKALTIRQAILVAIIFESLGAILAGGQVTDTIRSDIIDPYLFAHSPVIFVYGMLSALLAAGTWLFIASYKGWPVSTTHSIIGAIIGFAVLDVGSHAVQWQIVITIVLSWIFSPILAGIIAYITFNSIMRFILTTDDPILNAKRYLPIYLFIVAFIIAMVTLTKGLQHLNLGLAHHESLVIASLFSLFIMVIGVILLNRMQFEDWGNTHEIYKRVEKLFGILMVFSACAMAFSHGSNDIANAIGPVAAVISVVKSGGDVYASSPIPIWILFFGAFGMLVGLATYGHKVIATIGTEITDLTPSRGFAASFATASTVVIASGTGLPISTTQTLVGAVLGVGFARGIYAINLRVIRNIFTSWVITLPAGAILAIIYFTILRLIFMYI